MDRWWLENVKLIMDKDKHLQTLNFEELSAPEMLEAKKMGFSDNRLAEIFGVSEEDVRRRRLDQGIDAVCKLVDTCACEHEAVTPYYYTTYEGEDETRTSETPKVLILGGGPNRIGQGIEFDYCCCHAAFAVKELGYQLKGEGVGYFTLSFGQRNNSSPTRHILPRNEADFDSSD